jgi:hypothetical protein
VLSQNPYVEILLRLLEGGSFERQLGYEGKAPMNEISVLIKETQEVSFTPSAI